MGALLAVKQRKREADHSSPYSAKLKNEWSYTSGPPRCLYGVYKGQLYLYLTIVYVTFNMTLIMIFKSETYRRKV